MQTVTVEAQVRELLSRGKLNGLRRAGQIPGVVYGGSGGKAKKGTASKAHALINVNEKTFLRMLDKEGANVLLELQLGPEKTNAVIKELQRDYVTRKIIHVDFQRVDMAKKLEVMVPVKLSGESPGVKLHGGIMEYVTRELKVTCLPKDIPHEITVDISKVDIGHGITVADLPKLPGVDILADPHQLVVTVVAPTVLEEAPADAAASPTEPEVIAKGKKPEEGAEGADAPAATGKPGEKAAAPAKGAAPAAPGKGAPAK